MEDKIKKPIMPRSPVAPVPPTEFYDHKDYVLDIYDCDVSLSLNEIIKFFPEETSLDDIRFHCEYYYDNLSGGFYYMKKVKNPRFDKELIQFEKKLKKYNVEMEKYLIKKKKYDEQKKIYDDQQSARDLEEKQKRKKRLEKELAKLKKEIGE